jgi:hypothetical protein
MNLSAGLLGFKSRVAILVLASVTLLAAMSVLSGQAGAASGGIGSPGSSSQPTAQGSRATADAARYDRIWWSFAPRYRRWANKTSLCESGRNPRAIGGGGMYRGAFQFLKSTWAASPKSPGGDPIRYSYRTQGVVAVLLMQRDGAGHWPVCG